MTVIARLLYWATHCQIVWRQQFGRVINISLENADLLTQFGAGGHTECLQITGRCDGMERGGGLRMQQDCRGNTKTHAHILYTEAAKQNPPLWPISRLFLETRLIKVLLPQGHNGKPVKVAGRKTGQLIRLDDTGQSEVLPLYWISKTLDSVLIWEVMSTENSLEYVIWNCVALSGKRSLAACRK